MIKASIVPSYKLRR